jgi:hypothetical protein
MPIDVEWQDEQGNWLARYDGPAIDRRLAGAATEPSGCLRFIDPYGDTTFNAAQVAVLEHELASLLASIDGATREQAAALLSFVRRLDDRTHRYLKFIGD